MGPIEFKKLYTKYKTSPSDLSEEDIKSIQKFLAEKGYDLSYVNKSGDTVSGEDAQDGIIGEKFETAINGYWNDKFMDDYEKEALEVGEDGRYVNPEEAYSLVDAYGGVNDGRLPSSIDLKRFPDEFSFDGYERASVGDDTLLLTPQEKVGFDMRQRASERIKQEAETNRLAQEESDARAALDKDVQKKRADIYNTMLLGGDLMKTAQAISQIQAGKNQRQQLKRPEMPEIRPNELLREAAQDAQADAQYGLSDSARSAMNQTDLSNYVNALSAIKTSSGGQASNVGPQLQALYRQAIQRNLSNAMANDQLKNEKSRIAANLAGQSASEQAQLNRMNLEYGYMPRLKEYNAAMGEARRTEQVGRANMNNIFDTAKYHLSNVIPQYYRGQEQSGQMPLQGTQARRDYDAELEAEKRVRQKMGASIFQNMRDNRNQKRMDKFLGPNPVDLVDPKMLPQQDFGPNLQSFEYTV